VILSYLNLPDVCDVDHKDIINEKCNLRRVGISNLFLLCTPHHQLKEKKDGVMDIKFF
jgi:hypothetical protein